MIKENKNIGLFGIVKWMSKTIEYCVGALFRRSVWWRCRNYPHGKAQRPDLISWRRGTRRTQSAEVYNPGLALSVVFNNWHHKTLHFYIKNITYYAYTSSFPDSNVFVVIQIKFTDKKKEDMDLFLCKRRTG